MVGIGDDRLWLGRMASIVNTMSKDSNYLVNEDSSWPSNNDSDNKHGGGNLGLDKPNDPFVFSCDDSSDGDELHMWSNNTDHKFLSNMNVRPNNGNTYWSMGFPRTPRRGENESWRW